jgi:phosphate transport system protein
MKHTQDELMAIKDEVSQMWKLVLSQLQKTKQAFLNKDIELAREVVSREKRTNVLELKIDCDCENYIALYSPVAVDLRLILSLIKICGTLERIGDFCEGIARHVIVEDCNKMDDKLMDDLQMERLFDVAISMLSDTFVAFESEETKASGKILSKDEEIDKIFANAFHVLSNYLRENPDFTYCGLKIMVIIRKLERIGDHCSNIIEEIVFYVDAKVLKHSGKR